MGGKSKHHENKKGLCGQKYINLTLRKNGGHKPNGLGDKIKVTVYPLIN